MRALAIATVVILVLLLIAGGCWLAGVGDAVGQIIPM